MIMEASNAVASTDLASVANYILVVIGVIAVFIVANSHLQNQKDVQKVIQDNKELQKELTATVKQNDIISKKLAMGFFISNLQTESELRLKEISEFLARTERDVNFKAVYTAAELQNAKNRMEKVELSLRARSHEMTALFGDNERLNQTLVELETTFGDYDTLRFLDDMRNLSELPHNRDRFIASHAILARRLVN